jgi:hypothetical protein
MKSYEIKVSATGMGAKAGIIGFVLLVVYFIIMKFTNILQSEMAWAFNFVILLSVMLYTFNSYRSKTQPNVSYIPGFRMGCVIWLIAIFPYVLFVYGYTYLNPGILPLFKGNILFMTTEVTPTTVAASILLEGVATGIILTFTIMQYYKSGFQRMPSKRESMDNTIG